MRDPYTNPTPLDWASFYVEELKYGPGPGQVEKADRDEMIAQFEVLLRDAGVEGMTGEELLDASEFYCRSLVRSFGMPLTLVRSVWIDALMHGIALAGGLKGDHRNPRGEGEL